MALAGPFEMNVKIKQGKNFVVHNNCWFFFDAQEAQKISKHTVVWWIQLYLDSPLAGILISAHSNGLRVWQLYRLGGSKWRFISPLYLKSSLCRQREQGLFDMDMTKLDFNKFDLPWSTKNPKSTRISYGGFSQIQSHLEFKFEIILCIALLKYCVYIGTCPSNSRSGRGNSKIFTAIPKPHHFLNILVPPLLYPPMLVLTAYFIILSTWG